MRLIDLTGRTFGRLTVVGRASNDGRGKARWMCRCTCSELVIVKGDNLRNGHTQSCGCLSVETTKLRSTSHGHASHTAGASPTYRTWSAMIRRCTNQNAVQWPYYGGRGITVCERWRTFENFLTDMGERPAGKTIDRINVDGDYEPENCRWATAIEQNRNQRPRQKVAA